MVKGYSAMKTRLLIFFWIWSVVFAVGAVLLSQPAQAIPPAHAASPAAMKFIQFPLWMDGTMMPYQFDSADTIVPWGPELHPVFINYVARHGARYLSSEKKVEKLYNTLTSAQSDGRITPKGRSFLRLLKRVIAKTDGQWGALDSVGIREEQVLGKQMTVIAPELLKRGRVEAIATYVPRVVMTMYEFCHELARYSKDLEIYTSEGVQYNSLLRYFNTDTAYAAYIDHGPWVDAYDNYMRKTLPSRPAAEMVQGVADSHRLQSLTFDAYGVLQSLRAAGIVADPREWFTEEEYRACWAVANLRHYYQRSASSFSELPAQAATPLLREIISVADSVFEAHRQQRLNETVGVDDKGEVPLVASLHFGHAETVLPLFARMNLPGCNLPLLNPAQVAEEWKDWEISPLGANLMMVSLEDAEGREYVALRLNGRWQPAVIPWKTFKENLKL